MKESIKVIIAGVLIIPLLALGLNIVPLSFSSQQVGAVGSTPIDTGIRKGADAAKSDDQTEDLPNMFTSLTNTALFIIGAISVFMLIYGGILYTISGGDSTKVTNAKNTILYAIVGIIVALLAYAIVNYVLDAMGIVSS